MKLLKAIPLLFLFVLGSCASVTVSSDYDQEKDFNRYKTFAFYKKGIDKVEISDLDKRRIMKAIQYELINKGMQLSENPDLLVNIFAKSRNKIDVYTGAYYGWYPWYYGYGYGYGFGYGPGYMNVTESTEGTLFIDLIDAKRKELVWQGMGTGILSTHKTVNEKVARINEFVHMIMEQYPPGAQEAAKKQKKKK